jgi:hypothetical protein
VKLILSRKGFDSGIGKVPSPIWPDGRLYSLPIPETRPSRHSITYGDITYGNIAYLHHCDYSNSDHSNPGNPDPGNPNPDNPKQKHHSLAPLIETLTRGKITPKHPVHLDPDLDARSLIRPNGWQPCFGQAGAADRHLQRQGVTVGDLFLFFGWFRQIEPVAIKPVAIKPGQIEPMGQSQDSPTYRYRADAPDLHVIFGWLQVGQRFDLRQAPRLPPWALNHPHCQRVADAIADSLYVATPHLTLANRALAQLGAGLFPHFAPHRCLTAPGHSRSIWQLPAWFYPHPPRKPLTYHQNLHRWQQLSNAQVLLQSVGRGQEFVLDCGDYPEVWDWLPTLWET